MRALLGAGVLLKIQSRFRVRWYSKDKTFLPPKDLYERARRAIEAKARKLTHSARLRPGDAKNSETPALEILCRALASSSSAGSSSSGTSKEPSTGDSQAQQPTSSSAPSLSNKPPKIPLIPHENIKQNHNHTTGRLSIEKSGTPEIFNCKNCHENNSTEDQRASKLMLVNCKVSGGDGSILNKETLPQMGKTAKQSTSADLFQKPSKPPVGAAPKALTLESPQHESKSIGIINQSANPPVKAAPQEKPKDTTDTSRPQNKPAVQEKPKAPTPQSQSQSSNEPSTVPFPLGRNPCIDGKRGGEKSKPKAMRPSSCAEEEMDYEDDEEMGKCEKAKDCPPTKAAVPEPKEQKVKPVSPPIEKDDPPSQSKSQVKPSSEIVPDPQDQKNKSMSPPVNKDAPPKAAPQSQKWEQPPLPTSSFSFPLFSAFPLGRNPCRDGPRGGSEKESEVSKEKCEAESEEPEVVEVESKDSKQESKELSRDETCLSWRDPSTESSFNMDTSDCHESQKLPPPPEEIEAKADPPAEIEYSSPKPKAAKEIDFDNDSMDSSVVPKGSTDLKASESVPAKPSEKPTDAESNPEKEVLAASQKEVATASLSSKEDSEPPEEKAPPRPTSTEESQSSPNLKQFPVAPLHDSLKTYLTSIEPLLTAKEFKTAQKLTNEFEENEGQELQELLEAAADSSSNWLTPRWTQAAYLAYQAPLTVFSSPGLSFPVQKFSTPMECLTFTAKAIHATYEFKELVDQNKIPVVKMGTTDLDNSQFGKIFGTVRKPGRLCDSLKQHNKAQYVVVVYKYNFFKLPICSSSGDLLSVTSLRDELEAIVNCPLPRGEPFGLLTHDNRGNWAEAYGALCCPRGNADSVEAIEQSLFVVCLDDCVLVPKGQDSIIQAYQLLHGGGLQQNSANRWMDKTIQLIVNPNGLAGFCYEHSPADCQPLAMLMDFVLEKVNDSESEDDESNNSENMNPASLLKFQPRDECINLWLHAAMRNVQKIASVLRMNVFQYECHGKCFIKAQGLNPDSYIQMALQLAYYNMHKTIPAQYESAHLRMFVEGRTETIRSTSNESKAFVLAMNSLKASPTDQLSALQRAVDAHEKLTKLALHGKGIDRHLFGLKQMALEHCLPMPEFFRSKGYLRSVTFQLFTSQVATTHDSFMAYGPLTCDGYGCCYNPQNDKIIFAISAWQTSPKISPELYGKAIKKALDTMRKLILVTGGDRVGEHPCHCKNILT